MAAYAEPIKPLRTTRDEIMAIAKRAKVVPLVNITKMKVVIFLLRNLKETKLVHVYSRLLLRSNDSMMYCYKTIRERKD